MITGTPKPIEEILEMLEPYDNIIVAGCFGCVTVCRVGGDKEVQVLSSTLRLAREAAGKKLEIKEVCLERPGVREFSSWPKNWPKRRCCRE